MRTVSLTVVRRVPDGYDSAGRPAYREERDEVDGALTAPASSEGQASEDSLPERRGGSLTRRRFDLPKSYGASLAGASILFGGHEWRVVGDPEGYMDGNVPGPWGRPVIGERVGA